MEKGYDLKRERWSGDTEANNESNSVEVLVSKQLKIQSKRYYVDVKQIAQRKFIKIVESLPNGSKSRLTVPMPLVAELKEKLSEFLVFQDGLGPANPDEPLEDSKLKSDMLRGLGKRFYLDLKENHRGRFLRVSQATLNQPRCTITIPVEGISEVRDVLLDILDEYGSDDGATHTDDNIQLPEAEELKLARKRFYFDSGQNLRGSFLRISEVTTEYRSSITVPSQSLSEFADIVGKLAEKMNK